MNAQAFLRFCLERGVLRFGKFTLKSGRISPYFFNAGLFHQGSDLAKLGEFYAAALVHNGIEFDMMFGPAYKGIPLVSATAIALYRQQGMDRPWSFNRKEIKDHGEGGLLIGAPLEGRVLIIDDVITAGTAIRESLALIENAGARTAGVLIALDREERGRDQRSAIQEIEQDFGIPVIAVAKLTDLIEFAQQDAGDLQTHAVALQAYREQFGVSPELQMGERMG